MASEPNKKKEFNSKIAIQGVHGCFHEEAAKKFFQSNLEIEDDTQYQFGRQLNQNGRPSYFFFFRVDFFFFAVARKGLLHRDGAEQCLAGALASEQKTVAEQLDFRLVETMDEVLEAALTERTSPLGLEKGSRDKGLDEGASQGPVTH